VGSTGRRIKVLAVGESIFYVHRPTCVSLRGLIGGKSHTCRAVFQELRLNGEADGTGVRTASKGVMFKLFGGVEERAPKPRHFIRWYRMTVGLRETIQLIGSTGSQYEMPH